MGVIGAYLLASLAFLVFAWVTSRGQHESVGGLDVYAFPGFMKWFFFGGTLLSLWVVCWGVQFINAIPYSYLGMVCLFLCIFIATIYTFLVQLMLTDHAVYRQRWRPVQFRYEEVEKILLTRQNAYVVGSGGRKIYISRLYLTGADDLIRKLHARCPQAKFVDRITGQPIENF